MDQKEFAYAKQGVFATRSWEVFQSIVRKCLLPDSGGGLNSKRVTSGEFGEMSKIAGLILFLTALIGTAFCPGAEAMTRTLKEEPAIVIAAFGTTTRALETYSAIDKRLKDRFHCSPPLPDALNPVPGHQHIWMLCV